MSNIEGRSGGLRRAPQPERITGWRSPAANVPSSEKKKSLLTSLLPASILKKNIGQ